MEELLISEQLYIMNIMYSESGNFIYKDEYRSKEQDMPTEINFSDTLSDERDSNTIYQEMFNFNY